MLFLSVAAIFGGTLPTVSAATCADMYGTQLNSGTPTWKAPTTTKYSAINFVFQHNSFDDAKLKLATVLWIVLSVGLFFTILNSTLDISRSTKMNKLAASSCKSRKVYFNSTRVVIVVVLININLLTLPSVQATESVESLQQSKKLPINGSIDTETAAIAKQS
jgi:hypothetical protein